MNRIVSTLAISILATAAVPLARAQGPISEPITKGGLTIELDTIATGLNSPNTLTTAGDGSGRLFVTEQSGQVRLIENGQLAATPFLDLSGRIIAQGERGLLGLAFHPGYDDPSSPGFGTFYTYTSEAAVGTPDFDAPGGVTNHHSVIAEWRVDPSNPSLADPASRREIMRITQPQANHNAGALAFAPGTGLLHIALGDGGNANDQGPGHSPQGNGQDTTNVLGSFLRIDPLAPSTTPGSPDPVSVNGQYRVPADNPFVGSAGVDEIFASGFRNPFRFSFDSLTGDLYAGDVGQNNIEEVDLVTKGGDYGWNLKEGSFLFDPTTGGVAPDPSPDPNLIDPILEYDHDEGISVIGGFVYRGTAVPELDGRYIFGDLNGRLFAGDLSSGAITEIRVGLDDRGLGRSLIGFGEDEQHELYVLSTDFTPGGGIVQRIRAVPEPAGLIMLGSGVLGLIGLRRARRAGHGEARAAG